MVWMLFGILLFLIVYFSLVAGSIYLFMQALKITVYDDGGIWLKLIALVFSGLMVIFSVKFIFKWGRVEDPGRKEIYEKDHPELFAFIRQLTRDTGTKFPNKVFVSPDINAAVFYHSSFLSLFFPVRKNLLIGLGLVNCLDLSEFKSVLAHEFGHFSQRSMKFGSYVYTAQRIIVDMVYQRDAFDELIGTAGRIDFRIAVVAWAFYAVLWAIRKLLEGVLKVVMFLNGALSREMEFHADLVSVSVSGSMGIVRSLFHLELGMMAFQSTLHRLHEAQDTNIYTPDFFVHHQKMFELIQQDIPLPEGDRIFQEGDKHEMPDMYASHPPDFEREENARRNFVEAPVDKRSPWVLFGKADELKTQLTLKIYRNFLGLPEKFELDKIKNANPADMEAFIEAEISEKSHFERDFGIYAGSAVHALELEPEGLDPAPPELSEYEALLGQDLQDKMALRKGRFDEIEDLRRVLTGEKRVKKLVFRQNEYKPEQAKGFFEQVNKELLEDQAWISAFHQAHYNFHLRIAGVVGGEGLQEFKTRWEFNRNLWKVESRLEEINDAAAVLYEKFEEKEEFSESDVRSINQELQKLRNAYAGAIKKADFACPPMANIEKGASFQKLICPMEKIPNPANKFNNEFLTAFPAWLNDSRGRINRLYHKNLNSVLQVQDRMREAYFGKDS